MNHKYTKKRVLNPKSLKLNKIACAIRNIALVSSIAIMPRMAVAGPENGVITFDDVGGSIITLGTNTIIDQTGNFLYINWDSFNVALGETVTFNQPNSLAIALNNILDINPTTIFGQITANGRIFLINPNGIVFEPGSSVNVNGLIASTLEMSLDNFKNESYIFGEGSTTGNITNHGTLTASDNGYITLLGKNAENASDGIIVANKGQVNLISGSTVTFDFTGDGLMQFSVGSGADANTTVSNAGSITANGGWIVMSAESADNINANTVNNTGMLNATGIESKNGEVYLIGGAGDLDIGVVNASLLNVKTDGDITGSGAISVSGTTTLQTKNNSLITLDNENNDLGTVVVSSTGDTVKLVDSTGVDLGEITAKALTVIAQGDITQSGNLDITELASFDAKTANINLSQNTNLFGSLSLSGASATVTEADTTDLAAVTLSKDLTLTSVGTISDSGAVSVAGTATFNTGGNSSIILDSGSVDLGTLSVTSENDTVAVTDVNDIDLGAIVNATSLTITANGNITGSGAVVVTGATALDTGGGKSITLNNADNDFGTVTIVNTGDAVSLTDKNALDLAKTTAASLSLTAGGNITQSGDFEILGNASFTATGSDVILTTHTNNFGSLSLSGLNATVNEASTTDLTSVDVTNLTLTSVNEISGSGSVKVSGTATLDAGVGGTITLNNEANDFNKVVIKSSSGAVTLTDSNAIELAELAATSLSVTAGGDITQSGKITIAGNAGFTTSGAIALAELTATSLSATAGGDITQSGKLTIADNASFTANGADIILTDVTNTFGSLSLTGNNATVKEADAIELTSVNLINLTLTSVGNIEDTGTVVVTGTATFDTGGGASILLNSATNDFDTVVVSSGADTVSFTDKNAIDLGSMNAASLSVASNGDITNSGAIVITGSTDLNTGNDAAITLNHAGNDFVTVTVTSTGDAVSITDKNDLDIAKLNSASLSVTANGNISQSGDLTVLGNASFTANNSDITLANANNAFGSLSLSGINATVVEVDGTVLNGVNVTNLTLTSGNTIADSAAVLVTGIATFNTGSNGTITLDHADNNFANVVIASKEDDVTLVDKDTIDLGKIEAKSLTVSAGGDITQSDQLNIGGDASFNSNNANIVLTNIANSFGTLSLTGADATVKEADATDLKNVDLTNLTLTSVGNIIDSGTVKVSGTATFNTGSDSLITLDSTTNNFGTVTVSSTGDTVTLTDVDTINLASINAASLSVDANGNITQSGDLTILGTTALSTNGNSVLLDSVTNDFGTISVTGSNDSVIITDKNAINLGAINSNSLVVTASGNITQSGILKVANNAAFTANSADVTLTNVNNAFGNLSLTGNSANVNEIDSTILNTVDLAANLTLTSGDAITDTGTVKVGGTATLSAGNNSAITLDSVTNNFGTVSATAGAITLVDVDAIDLGALNATSLSVTTGGNITNSGAVVVTGLTTLNTGNDALITLDHSANNFATITVTSSGDAVTVKDTDAIILGGMTASSLSVEAGGDITQSGSLVISSNAHFNADNSNVTLSNANNAFGSLSLTANNATVTESDDTVLQEVTVTDLFLTSTGAITDSGVVKVSGTAALTAGDGAAITLDTVGNDLGTLSITSLNNAVTLNDVNEVDLGAMDVASLDVTSGGNITNSGAVVVAGLTALNAQNNASITLNNAGNDFSTVSVTSSGNAVNLSDSNDIELAAMMAASLTVTTGAGNITQSGGLTVSGNATFDAGTFDVTLQESNNHFNSLSITANNASINEADDTNLNTVTVANNLTLTSAGNITDTGVVTVGGVASFNATGSITLNSGNNFNTVSASSGGDVLLTDSNGIDLGVINATNLTVSAGDSITNSGAIDVGGLTILSAANNASITLNDTGNNFGTVSVTSEGNAVSLVDINEIDLATMNSASLSVTTNGNISQSGSLNITGAADFNAGTADVILTNAGNTFGTLSITANNANVSEEDDTDLESVNVTSELVLTSGGSISDGSNDATAVVVAGNATFSAGDNRAITLDGAANNFGVVTIASSSNNVTLNDIDSIELGSISAQSLTVTAQNNITQTGDVNTSGSIDYTTGTGDIAIAGAVTAGGSLIATSGNSISQTGVVSVSGDVTYQANAGDVVIGNAQDDEVSLTAQNVNITAENKITQNGGVNASGDISYTTTSSEAGDIAIVGVIDAGGSLTVTAANSIAQTGSVTATGDVAYQALGGNVTIGNVLNTAGSLTVNAFDSIAQTASVSAQGSVSYQTGETGGDIVIEGLLNSGGSMTLDAQIDVTASNALTSGGDMIIKAFTGSIDITTATAQTIDFEAAKGSIFADTISSTATTSVEGTSNLRLTATQVGTEGRLITLEVATGTATLVLDGINNTNLFDNAVSRSALLEQYVSNNVTVRGDDIVSTPAFSSAEAQSAANAGRSTTNVDNQEEGLASDESLYTTPEPSIKLPADQDEPDEFAKVEKHSDNKATDKVSGSGGFSGFVSTLIKTLNFNK